MELTQKQQEGLKLTLERYKNGERYVVISGYAGTGKSTLVKFIISALQQEYDIDPETDVVYTSFTGKATQVLQKKGNKNVSTLHKLLYEWYPRKDGTFFKRPISYLDFKIVVVDEVSMVPMELMTLLFSHQNIFIICLRRPRTITTN